MDPLSPVPANDGVNCLSQNCGPFNPRVEDAPFSVMYRDPAPPQVNSSLISPPLSPQPQFSHPQLSQQQLPVLLASSSVPENQGTYKAEYDPEKQYRYEEKDVAIATVGHGVKGDGRLEESIKVPTEDSMASPAQSHHESDVKVLLHNTSIGSPSSTSSSPPAPLPGVLFQGEVENRGGSSMYHDPNIKVAIEDDASPVPRPQVLPLSPPPTLHGGYVGRDHKVKGPTLPHAKKGFHF